MPAAFLVKELVSKVTDSNTVFIETTIQDFLTTLTETGNLSDDQQVNLNILIILLDFLQAPPDKKIQLDATILEKDLNELLKDDIVFLRSLLFNSLFDRKIPAKKRKQPKRPPTSADTNDDNSLNLLNLYYQETYTGQFLTAEEEVTLMQTIERGQVAAKSLAMATTKLSSKKRKALKQEVVAGQKARETMILKNTRLVIDLAKKYYKDNIELDLLDLIQDGNEGLIKAVNQFEWQRGNKFSTYATWVIFQNISRGIIKTGRTIKLSIPFYNTLQKYKWQKRKLQSELSRKPAREELMAPLGISKETIQLLEQYLYHPKSLDLLVEKKEAEPDLMLGDLIPNLEKPVIEQVIENVRASEIATILSEFSEREVSLLVEIFVNDTMVKDIAEKWKITPERVRQINKTTFDRLKNRKVLKDFY